MVAPPQLRRLTVAEAVTEYLVIVNRQVLGDSLSPNTAANYARDLEEFIALVGAETVLDDLTGADVDQAVLDFRARPDQRFKPKPNQPVKTRGVGAQVRFRQSVARLFSTAVVEGWVQANPMPRTTVRPKMPGLANVARRALPEPSAVALLDLAAAAADTRARTDMRLGLRDQFLLRLLMEAGPRVSEVSAANRVDLEARHDGTVWLRVLGKGRKERWLPLSEDTYATYQAYVADERPPPRPRTRKDPVTGETVVRVPAADADQALLLTWRGLRMTPRDIQLMVQRACARLPGQLARRVTPHGLRHTAATLLLTSGAADISTVRALLGHASIATTGLYLDTVTDEMAAAVRAHPVTGQPRRKSG